MAVSVETIINNVARALLDTAFRTWSRAEHVANLNDAIRLSEYGGWVVLVAGPHHANLSFDYVEHRLREAAARVDHRRRLEAAVVAHP